MRLILASASLRRAELLQSAGFEFEIEPAEIDEVPIDGEAPVFYTLRVAREKAQRVADRHRGEDVVVLGADTEVVIKRRILGKPRDLLDARRMLEMLSGQDHWVYTGVVLIRQDRQVSAFGQTLVSFTTLSVDEVNWYLGSGEPMGKAGAYAIQGLAARFIQHIEGSWSNVVGLPIATVHRLLGEVQ